MKAISFIGKLQSKGRIQVPTELREQVEELEKGSWYEVTIERKVREPQDDSRPVIEGGLGSLIAQEREDENEEQS